MRESLADSKVRKALTARESAVTGTRCCLYCFTRVPLHRIARTSPRAMCMMCDQQRKARLAQREADR